jgi:hypothetical protein
LILTVSKQPKAVKKRQLRQTKPKPLYRQPLPSLASSGGEGQGEEANHADLKATPIPESNFTLREDGTISDSGLPANSPTETPSAPQLTFSDPAHGVWLYHGNCLQLLDAIAAKYPEGRFDMIFADPPNFLSNGGITCYAGKMVKVDKRDWDKSKGPEVNHEFKLEWLNRQYVVRFSAEFVQARCFR